MNEPTIFKFEQNDVRTITDEHGEPWFVAKDVCEVLEIERTDSALRNLDDDEKGTRKMSTLVGELAKLLRQNGVEIGQNRLFTELREDGFLIKRQGTDYNMPTQRSMEMGLFEIKERAFSGPNGAVRITKTPKVTGKGQVYFANRYLGKLSEDATA